MGVLKSDAATHNEAALSIGLPSLVAGAAFTI